MTLCERNKDTLHRYLCFLSFETVVMGFLNLGTSQSNMSSSRGYIACLSFFGGDYVW